MTVTIPEKLQPVWVGDATVPEWQDIYNDDPYYVRLIEWLRGEGFDENTTFRVEVYLLDVPFAKVFQYVNDERGLPQLNEAGDDALSVVRTAVLSSLPPVQRATAGRAIAASVETVEIAPQEEA